MDHPPFPHRPTGSLARYRSAPGSLLASIAESVIGDGGGGGGVGELQFPAAAVSVGRYLSGESPCLTSESTCIPADPYGVAGMQQGFSEISAGDLAGDPKDDGGGGGVNHLIRHSSSPAGFFSHLLVDEGLPIPAEIGHYSLATNGAHAMANRRLKSQLSFSRQDTLSQISEVNILDMGESIWGNNSGETPGNGKRSYMSNDFPIGSWDETNSPICSGPPNKRSKDNNRDIAASFSGIDSQFNASLEMSTMEKFLQIQQESGPFKIRAKRGCATHPRSIAERDRRTRISEKLRKLQELVPNMDKQTCTSDMLDLAVQHIKELQSQVQILSVLPREWIRICKWGISWINVRNLMNPDQRSQSISDMPSQSAPDQPHQPLLVLPD